MPMTREEAKATLLRAFAATGEVPREWLDLVGQILAPPAPPRGRRR